MTVDVRTHVYGFLLDHPPPAVRRLKMKLYYCNTFRRDNQTRTTITCRVSEEAISHFLSPHATRKVIQNLFRGTPVAAHRHRKFTDIVLTEATQAFGSSDVAGVLVVFEVLGKQQAPAHHEFEFDGERVIDVDDVANDEGIELSRKYVESRLEKFTWSNNETEDEQCAVCMVDFEVDKSNVCRLPCRHVFHSSCIFKWFEKRHCCPLCRSDLKK